MTADMDGPWPLPTGGLWPPNHPARPTAAPVSEVRIELLGPEPEEARPCERCDDTGDMHRADGEWMGFCMCDAGRRLRYGDAATEAMKYRSTHKAMDDMGVSRVDAEGRTLSLFGRITRAVVDHGREKAAAATPASSVKESLTVARPMAPTTTEHHIALREAYGYRALEDYFAPRPVEDGAMQRRAFEQGYQRGFDKAAELYAAPPARPAVPAGWRDHVEQRLHSWRQSFVNRSGDQLALDDFMDQQSLDDLIDYVCDEWAGPAAPSAPAPVALSEEQIKAAIAGISFNEMTAVNIARAAIAEFCRINGITAPSAAAGGPNVGIEPPYSVGSNDGLGPA